MELEFNVKCLKNNGTVETKVRKFNKTEFIHMAYFVDEIVIKGDELKLYMTGEDDNFYWIEVQDQEFKKWIDEGRDFTHMDCINYIFKTNK